MITKVLLRSLLMLILVTTSLSTFGQTQAEMNSQAYAGYQKADKELNVVYQRILKEYSSQSTFLKNFKTAQRLWVQLRDAELATMFPEQATYGSVNPMCKSMYLESLTRERIKFLKVWLDGTEQGDVCSGSVKFKE